MLYVHGITCMHIVCTRRHNRLNSSNMKRRACMRPWRQRERTRSLYLIVILPELLTLGTEASTPESSPELSKLQQAGTSNNEDMNNTAHQPKEH